MAVFTDLPNIYCDRRNYGEMAILAVIEHISEGTLFSGRLYSINSSTLIWRYQHNLHINPVSNRLPPSRQYLLKLVRGISRSLQILFLLIPFSPNISFIRKCKLPYSIKESPLLFTHYFILNDRNIIHR